ncbi:MAG: prolipoprotein diacylglyceryl transferase [Deltaproteobacteria bacterium]|nr:prolipoprotein diacylglyceryl transferase [Deltaproteobacteria bacterium]
MKPIFFEFTLPVLGKVEFPAYMTMIMVGFIVSTWLCRREEDLAGRNGDRIVDLALLMLVFGVLGARLLSVLADGHLRDFVNLCVNPKLVPAIDAKVLFCTTDAQCGYDYLCDTETSKCYPPKDCLAAFKFWQGGLAFYGGLLAAAPVGLWFAHKKKLGTYRVADLTAPMIALGLFFGRLGCFFNGCCYGTTTSVPWAVDFPGHHDVHPTQLYESGGALLIFMFLYFVLRPRKRAHGELFGALLALYGVLRFSLEFLRADERGGVAGLSTSQWIGVLLVPLGICLWVARRRLAGKPFAPTL